jgi:hypothetical protein
MWHYRLPIYRADNLATLVCQCLENLVASSLIGKPIFHSVATTGNKKLRIYLWPTRNEDLEDVLNSIMKRKFQRICTNPK